MEKYVVSLLDLLFFPVLQTPRAVIRHSTRVGSVSTTVVAASGQRHFVSPSVIIISPRPARFVRGLNDDCRRSLPSDCRKALKGDRS